MSALCMHGLWCSLDMVPVMKLTQPWGLSELGTMVLSWSLYPRDHATTDTSHFVPKKSLPL